jgi:ABC-type nickel/cobalt efflux system permease component RcnA
MVMAPSEPPLAMKLDMSTATTALMILIPHALTFCLVVSASLFAKNNRDFDFRIIGIVLVANITYFLTKEKQWQKKIAELEIRSKQDYEEYQKKLQHMKKQYQNYIEKIQKEKEHELLEEFNESLQQTREREHQLYELKLDKQHYDEMKEMKQQLEAQRRQLDQEKKEFLLEHNENEQALKKKIDALETALLHY